MRLDRVLDRVLDKVLDRVLDRMLCVVAFPVDLDKAFGILVFSGT